MCGLFGTVLEKGDDDEVNFARRARDILIHRGPDQAGEWICDGLYMGHRRLSILDLSEAGRQPMVSDDGQVGITVNGEIYNFLNLKKDLEIAGYTFKSTSDSEVVLHGFRHWGLDGLAERMDGMYAIVIHDHGNKMLHAIRDRVGIKPLFYYHNNRELSWASELKALQDWLPPNKKNLDNTALYDFLTYRYIPAPKSLYRNIFKLPPAHILSFRLSDGQLDLKRYWQLPVSSRTDSHDKLAKELLSLIQDSVKEQMISDVPIGFLLSGGVDSSAITMLGAKLSSQPMSFSIGFPDSDRDESPYAQLISEQVGSEHFLHIHDDEEMENLLARMREWFDEPFGDTSAIPTYRVCNFARKKLTVALSGDGGDELFGGYRWYDLYYRLQKLQRFIPFGSRRGFNISRRIPKHRILTLLSIHDPLEQYARLRGGLDKQSLKSWRTKLDIPDDYDRLWAYRACFDPSLPRRKAAQIMDFHTYLPDDILTKVDRTSMAVSLECRPPFLSRALIEFPFSLPENFLYKGNELKGGMKYSFKDFLPDKILNRGKQGFSVPDRGWRKNAEASGSLQELFLEQFLL
ncbi:MAG: asparagine synthase (glutamine-hydrolyzing) [Alphaproteobacteria bacterium]|nr:asparagine synthase (glutamine-hydrolyzing) [Alphaproteobacteria bacterium]